MPTLALLNTADLKDKTVFYRADYNVPLDKSVITDPFRITSSYPTIDYLRSQGARIVIGTHLGRPDGVEVPGLSVRPIAQVLADKYPDAVVNVAYKPFDPTVQESIHAMKPGDILLLENLRFWAEEEGNNAAFAKQLAELAEVYVNDAFACDHRAHASIVGIPAIIPGFAGYLLEKEISTLGNLLENPAHPFVVVMGGAKVSDKIEVIRALAKVADTILIGGAMANTFLLAKGEKIGDSKAEPDKADLAKNLLEEFPDKIVVAEDFVKDGEGDHFRYLDIGPKATETFGEILMAAKTIFWNGSLGYAEDPKYAVATNIIAKSIGDLPGVTSVVAGGDTVGTITKLDLYDKFSFISTGGGAALEFLAGEALPGVEALKR